MKNNIEKDEKEKVLEQIKSNIECIDIEYISIGTLKEVNSLVILARRICINNHDKKVLEDMHYKNKNL